MIRAVRRAGAARRATADEDYDELVRAWGVTPYLQTLLADACRLASLPRCSLAGLLGAAHRHRRRADPAGPRARPSPAVWPFGAAPRRAVDPQRRRGGGRGRSAVDAAGRTVATVTLRGIDPYDPEALAPRQRRRRAGRRCSSATSATTRGAPPGRLGVPVRRAASRLGDQTVEADVVPLHLPGRAARRGGAARRPARRPHLDRDEGVLGGGLYRAPRSWSPRTEGINKLTARGRRARPWSPTARSCRTGGSCCAPTRSAYLYDAPGTSRARARCRPSRRASRWPSTATGCWSAARAGTREVSPCRCPAVRRRRRPDVVGLGGPDARRLRRRRAPSGSAPRWRRWRHRGRRAR